VNNGARSASVPPQQAPTSNPSRLAPASNTTAPGIGTGLPPLGTSLSANSRRPISVPPLSEIPGVTNGVIGGRSPGSVPGSDGRQFASRLPVVAEPAPTTARPGQPVAAVGTSANGRPAGSAMPPPMMGAGAGGGGSSTRRTKYWTPTSEAFDVDLPPHVDGVIGAEPEDAR
jgi:hypothetical protein